MGPVPIKLGQLEFRSQSHELGAQRAASAKAETSTPRPSGSELGVASTKHAMNSAGAIRDR